jgi:hypothetical protein
MLLEHGRRLETILEETRKTFGKLRKKPAEKNCREMAESAPCEGAIRVRPPRAALGGGRHFFGGLFSIGKQTGASVNLTAP